MKNVDSVVIGGGTAGFFATVQSRVYVMFALGVLLLCAFTPQTEHAETAMNEEAAFPALLDSSYFSTDTVSFSRFDKKLLPTQERLRLLRTALKESRVLDTLPIGFFEKKFEDISDLRTYEEMSFEGDSFIQGNGRAEIFILDIDGDKTDDLIVRYSNGADDNGCFYFAKRNGKYKYLFSTSAYINYLNYTLGVLTDLRYVSLACCDYPYNTIHDVVVSDDSLIERFKLRSPHHWRSHEHLAFMGRTNAVPKAFLRPRPLRHTDEPKVKHNGTTTVREGSQLGVYQEKVVDEKTWLLVMEFVSGSRYAYTMGWVEKSETDWK